MTSFSPVSHRNQPLSRLQRALPPELEKSFTPLEVKKLRDMFACYDSGNAAHLTRLQTGRALSSLSQNLSEKELDVVVDAALTDPAEDKIDFAAFCHVMYNTKAFHHASAFSLNMTQRRIAQSEKSNGAKPNDPINTLQRYEDGSQFKGQTTKYGVFHGKGSYDIGSDGAVYTGAFSQGLFHGHGQLWYPDCSSFEGDFVKGVRSGEGTMACPDGSSYVGHLDMGLFHGYGEYTCGGTGDVHKGLYNQGKKEGAGKMFYRDGSTFEGLWHNNHRRPGAGTLEWDNGDSYHGVFAQNGLYHGQGRLTLAHSGDTYEGAFDNGRKHGVGKMKYNNGDNYEGDWFKGTKTGRGVYFFADGNEYRGDWVNDRMEGCGQYRFKATGDVFEGQFYLDHPHGQGTASYAASKSTYVGSFRQGVPCGRGAMTTAQAGSWTGQWRGGKRVQGTEECPETASDASDEPQLLLTQTKELKGDDHDKTEVHASRERDSGGQEESGEVCGRSDESAAKLEALKVAAGEAERVEQAARAAAAALETSS